MKKIFAPFALIFVPLLLFSGGSFAQTQSAGTEMNCEPKAEQDANQAKSPHYAPSEPWKKQWAVGAAHFMVGKFPEAEIEVSKALELAQNAGYTDVQPGVLQMLGLIYLQEGKYNQATQTLQKAISMEKSNRKPFKGTIYAALIGLGDTYRRQTEYDKALPTLLEAKGMMTPCSPGYKQLLENLAQVYAGMDKLAEAEATYNDLVRLAERTQSDELMYASLTNLGEVQLQRKEYEQLSDTLERAYPYVVQKFGEDSQQTKIFAKNIEHVKNARDAAPTYSGAAQEWMRLMASGNKNLNEKHYPLAVNDFEKALKLSDAEGTQTPPTAITRARLALAYSYTGNFKKAEVLFAQSLPILREHPEVISSDMLASYEKIYQLAQAKNKATH